MKAPAPALALLAALLLAFVSLPASAKGPRVEGLQASFEAGQVFVSFRLEGAFERADIREAVQSTQPLVFTFTVEVTKKRTAWKNKTLGRRVLLRRITYDTLDGETTGSVTVSSYDDLAGAVGRVDHLAVCSVADMAPDASYEARAKVKLLDDFTLWIIPWDLETPWREEALLTP